MSVLEDPQEFGRRVSAARGYARMKKPEFSKSMGKSVPTVTRWERGEVGSIGSTIAERRQLAERIVKATGCPPEWFDVDDAGDAGTESFPMSDEIARLATLEMLVDEIRKKLADQLGVDLEADEERAAQQSESSAPSSGASEPEAANG